MRQETTIPGSGTLETLFGEGVFKIASTLQQDQSHASDLKLCSIFANILLTHHH